MKKYLPLINIALAFSILIIIGFIGYNYDTSVKDDKGLYGSPTKRIIENLKI